MSILTGFVIILIQIFIIYMFYRLYLTQELITLISLSLQTCIFTIAALSFFGRVGTSELIESLYLLIGIFLPGVFLAYDYCRMISRVKRTGIYGGFIEHGTLNERAGIPLEFNPAKIHAGNNTVESNLNEWNLQFNSGVTFNEQGRYAEAVEAFKKALNNRPDEYLINYHIGSALIELKRYNEALDYYKRALAVRLSDSEIFYNIAVVYSLLRKYDISAESLRRAIELNDDMRADAICNSAFDGMKKRPEFKPILYKMQKLCE